MDVNATSGSIGEETQYHPHPNFLNNQVAVRLIMTEPHPTVYMRDNGPVEIEAEMDVAAADALCLPLSQYRGIIPHLLVQEAAVQAAVLLALYLDWQEQSEGADPLYRKVEPISVKVLYSKPGGVIRADSRVVVRIRLLTPFPADSLMFNGEVTVGDAEICHVTYFAKLVTPGPAEA